MRTSRCRLRFLIFSLHRGRLMTARVSFCSSQSFAAAPCFIWVKVGGEWGSEERREGLGCAMRGIEPGKVRIKRKEKKQQWTNCKTKYRAIFQMKEENRRFIWLPLECFIARKQNISNLSYNRSRSRFTFLQLQDYILY